MAGAVGTALRPRWRRIGVVLAGFALYLAAFGPMHAALGNAAATASGLVVVLAGLLLGWRGGLASGLALVAVHTVLMPAVGRQAVHVVAGGIITGTGMVVGRLRDLGRQVRRSHAALEVGLRQAREAQQSLAEREAQLSLAQEVSGTGYMVSSGAAAATWSAELRRILGEPPDGTPPSLGAFLDRIHPEDRARILRQARRARAEGVPVQGDFRLVRPDGEVRWVHGRIRPLRDPASGG